MEEKDMIREMRIKIDEMKFAVRQQRRASENATLKADFLEREVIGLETIVDKWLSKSKKDCDLSQQKCA